MTARQRLSPTCLLVFRQAFPCPHYAVPQAPGVWRHGMHNIVTCSPSPLTEQLMPVRMQVYQPNKWQLKRAAILDGTVERETITV